jgi:hypothetical protein
MPGFSDSLVARELIRIGDEAITAEDDAKLGAYLAALRPAQVQPSGARTPAASFGDCLVGSRDGVSRTAEVSGSGNLRRRVAAELSVRRRAESIVDGREGESQGHEDGHGEDLRIGEAGVSEILKVSVSCCVGLPNHLRAQVAIILSSSARSVSSPERTAAARVGLAVLESLDPHAREQYESPREEAAAHTRMPRWRGLKSASASALPINSKSAITVPG